MKLLSFFALLLFSSLTGGSISEANLYKDLAREAYQKGDYQQAIQRYHYLVDTLQINDPALYLNLGHSYYQYLQAAESNPALQQEEVASELQSSYGIKMLDYYTQAANASNEKPIKANAFHQLGVGFIKMAKSYNNSNDKDAPSMEERYTAAIESFKNALKNDPYNEDTRYNYELVKKLFDEFKKQQEENKKQNKDEQQDDKKKEEEEKKKEEQNKDEKKKDEDEKQKEEGDKGDNKQDQEGKKEEGNEKSDETEGKPNEKQEGDPSNEGDGKEQKDAGDKQQGGSDSKEDPTKEQQEALKKLMKSKRLKEINMTKEKAKMILEAMKAQEMQYYQNMRKGVRTPRNSSKPDW